MNKKLELPALQAGAQWLHRRESTRQGPEQGGQLAVAVCRQYGVSRRALDEAILDLQLSFAYPSQEFINARAVAERLKGAPLTALELQALVRAIKQQEASNASAICSSPVPVG